jgi:DNA-directed RNA polymerase subunit beta
MPNLIEVRKNSYDHFLQAETRAHPARPVGPRGSVPHGVPITDFSGKATLEFVHYELETPKYDVEECQQRGMTFAAPLKVKLRLVGVDVDEETGAKSVRDVKEQDVYMGDMPLMTKNGTFVVNGTERVIVSQIAPLARRVLRPRQGQDPFLGQVPLRAPRHPLSRLLARLRFDAKEHRAMCASTARKLPVTTLLLAPPIAETEKLVEDR